MNKKIILQKLETDQDTGYEIYLTTAYWFLVNEQAFNTYSEAKEYCRAMYLSY